MSANPPTLLYRDILRADIADALPPAVRSAGLLRPELRPLLVERRIFGPAVTAYCAPGDSVMSHCALYFSKPGDVLVISNGGVPEGAIWGGTMAVEAKRVGVAGVMVDGPVRDVETFRALPLPVWASAVSASRAEKRGRGYVNQPVSCGGCVVNPGDIVVADDDGILAFAPRYLESIVAATRQRKTKDAALLEKMKAGERIYDIIGIGSVLQAAGADIREGIWRSGE
jgi:4-hydroxy-4-methyl-2-oxoglutarate aldolase